MEVLIADDNPQLHEKLRELLVPIDRQPIIHDAQNAEHALQLANHYPSIEIALLNLFFRRMDGFQFLRQFCNHYPALPVIVIATSASAAHIRKIFDMGVSGYVPASVEPRVLRGAIRKVLDGGVYIPPDELLNKAGRIITAGAAPRTLSEAHGQK